MKDKEQEWEGASHSSLNTCGKRLVVKPRLQKCGFGFLEWLDNE